MEEKQFDAYKRISVVMLALTLGLIGMIYFIIYTHDNFTSASPLIFYLVKYYLYIMVALIFVSAMLGYLFSMFTYRKLAETKNESRRLLDMLLLFLGTEEKEIIQHLMAKDGVSNQAQISKLPSMNRVKAHRSLQKMQEKNIVEVIPHGKMRMIHLNENIRRVL